MGCTDGLVDKVRRVKEIRGLQNNLSEKKNKDIQYIRILKHQLEVDEVSGFLWQEREDLSFMF